MKKPTNLRVDTNPYPHLRDDDGCVLANDYLDHDKLDYILAAVREKSEREARLDRVAPQT